MESLKRALSFAAAIILIGCQTTGNKEAPPDKSLWFKYGVSGEEHLTQYQDCSDQAKYARPNSSLGYGQTSGGVLGAIAGAITVGVIEGVRTVNAWNDAYDNCMVNDGYMRIQVPDATVAAYRSGDEGQKAAIIEEFMASDTYAPYGAYTVAREANNETAYADYLAAYPTSPFAEEAATKLNRIRYKSEWLTTIGTGTFLLELAASELRGLNSDGWIALNGSDTNRDCSVEVPIVLRAVLSGGLLDGTLKIDGGRTVPVSGRLNNDQSLIVQASWPTEDPIQIKTTLHDTRTEFDGYVSATETYGCQQFTWFSHVRGDGELGSSQESPSALRPFVPPSEWLGREMRSPDELRATLSTTGS